MIIILSPSKSMQAPSGPAPDGTQPDFLEQSEQLVSNLRKRSESELSSLMKISENLARQTRQRFKEWSLPFNADNANPAAFMFSGAVYDGLEASSLGTESIRFAQEHLRILSALYGVLRPLDLMQAYRLEMADSLRIEDARNLYEFWRQPVTDKLNSLPGDMLINLASQEYFKVIDKKRFNKKIVTPVFQDEKNGKLKIISLYAKRARGVMARWIIQKRITRAEDLLAFDGDGYTYDSGLSTKEAPVFTRPEQA